PENKQPESEPLFLPSALSEAERENGGCTKGLLEMELLLRDAQCRASLVKLQNQLVIKGRFLNYKALHARHQGATTRACGIVNRNEIKIRLHSEKYQCAWNVLFAYAGQDEGRVGWQKLRKEDVRCMEDANDLAVKEAKQKKARERRKRKLDELVAHAVDAPGWLKNAEDEDLDGDEEGRVGESRRQVSWIWMGAGMTGTDAELEDGKWCLQVGDLADQGRQLCGLSGPMLMRGLVDGTRRSGC
ncbi:hypothetical protein B0H14DRAFT_2383089, partial [Mycena olivaceomarginata]